LEWQDIVQIDNLELFSNLRSLHLQYNLIQKLENLEFLTKLEYLSLEGNLIPKIENLKTLKNLLYLNLANNKIQSLDLSQIPAEISLLKLGGNPCTENEDYRAEVIQYFEFIDELDGISVTREKFLLSGIDCLPERNEEFVSETEMTDATENFKFMNEGEESMYSEMTEVTWNKVQKSKERLEELMRVREEFHNRLVEAKRGKDE